jgi:hypothetical protein
MSVRVVTHIGVWFIEEKKREKKRRLVWSWDKNLNHLSFSLSFYSLLFISLFLHPHCRSHSPGVPLEEQRSREMEHEEGRQFPSGY